MTVRELAPSALAARLRFPGIILRVGPFVIRLQTQVPAVVEALRLLYADFPVAPPEGLADFHLRVTPPRGLRRWWRPQVLFLTDGRSLFEPLPRAMAAPLLEWGLNRMIASRAHQYLILHAAAVEQRGRALVMPAPPGSGKSTLCAALTHRGWRLLSDEFALIRPADGRLVPLPRPVSLKDASIDVIRAFAPAAVLGPRVADTVNSVAAYMRPPGDSAARAQETALPAWIVFPRFQSGASTVLTPIPRARAFFRLAENAFNYTLLGKQGFETLARTIEACDAFEFVYSDLDEAVALFASLADRHPPALDPEVVAMAGCGQEQPLVEPRAESARAGRTGGAGAEGPLLLLDAMAAPERLRGLGETGWDHLLRQGRCADALGRLDARVTDRGLLHEIPPRVADHFQAARARAGQHERLVRLEVRHLEQALGGTGVPLVLLKGAAYVMQRLPVARGRLFGDVDILVPQERLGLVEQALVAHGWEHVTLDPYDQRYYRTWMHELPPLRHRERQTVVDVHHTILPRSGRLGPDAGLLLEAARPVGGSGLRVLAPAEILLHSAAHLFQDGDFQGGLRDLLDLDGLLRHFAGADAAFWEDLAARASQLGLDRPLFYALRFTSRLLGTPLSGVGSVAAAGRPPRRATGPSSTSRSAGRAARPPPSGTAATSTSRSASRAGRRSRSSTARSSTAGSGRSAGTPSPRSTATSTSRRSARRAARRSPSSSHAGVRPADTLGERPCRCAADACPPARSSRRYQSPT